MQWPLMEARSEDDGKSAAEDHAAPDDYEGDYGEPYGDEDEELYGVGDGYGAAGETETTETTETGVDGEDGALSADTVSESDGDEDADDLGDLDDFDGLDDLDDLDEADVDDGLDLDPDHGHDHDRDARQSRRRAAVRGPPLPLPPQHNFAPPFYGRPPTPLPPSPSLTSLLRPSRPTTPDATDDELEPVPRAAPQVPTYEYYGFVLYLFSSLAFLIYLLWSYLPSPFLHGLGIYYYPNRWWSLAIPSFLVSSLVYTYVALASYNTEILTLPLNNIETIVDGAAKMAAVDDRGRVVAVGGQNNEGGYDGGGGSSYASKSSKSSKSSRNGQTASRHYRQASSPSPPLGGPGGRRQNKNKTKQGRRGGEERGGGGGGGLTMGSGRQTWKRRQSDGREADGRRSRRRGPPDWTRLWNEGTDAVMDIPLAGVCEVLYA